MKFIFYIIALIIWATSFIFDVLPLGYSETSPLWTRLTYMFTHIGFLHLFFNLLSVDLLLYSLRRFILPDILLPIAIIGAFVATFGTEKALPTIGASGIVYFLFGVLGVMKISIRVIVAISLLVVINVVLSFHNVNTGVHMMALFLGLVFGFILNIRTGVHKRIHKTHTA